MVLSNLFSSRYFPDLIAVSVALLAQWVAVLWILRGPAAGAPRSTRLSIVFLTGVSAAVVVLGFLLRFVRIARHFPVWMAGWGRAMAITWALLSLTMLLAFAISRLLARISVGQSAGRRRFLRTAEAVILGTPIAAIAYGTF